MIATRSLLNKHSFTIAKSQGKQPRVAKGSHRPALRTSRLTTRNSAKARSGDPLDLFLLQPLFENVLTNDPGAVAVRFRKNY